MKRDQVIYYTTTGILTVIILFSVSMYFFKHEMIKGAFENFGYPTYIIYPYAVAKLLGLIALWVPHWSTINEWAYAGFFYAILLAFFAHYMIGDGQHGTAVLALVALVVSYIFYKRNNK